MSPDQAPAAAHRLPSTAAHGGTHPQEPAPGPAPVRPALVANLIAQLAFGLLAMTICLPSMQEWGAIFTVDQPAVQLTFSGFVLTYGGLQVLYGPLSDRLGRRRILLFGLALAAAGSLLAALAPGLPLLVAGRVLQGAGAAAGMVIGRAMVQDLFDGPERTRVMAYIGMTMGLCPPLATILGGQLHVHLGWRANFGLMALLAVVLWLAAWRGLPAAAARSGATAPGSGAAPVHWLPAMFTAYARLLREARFLPYVGILAMATATFYAFLGGAPIVLGSLGVGPDGIGFYIMAIPLSYILGNYLTTHLVKRHGERRMMVAGQAATVAGIALMLLLGLAGWRSALAFALPLTLLGVGHGLLVPPALAGTVGVVPALAGSAAAVAGLAQQMLGALGGWAVGLVRHDGVVNLGWLMLGLALAGVAAQSRLYRRDGGPIG